MRRTGRHLLGWGRAEPVAAGALWPADRVIFANDVFFCARDALRLLSHRADMVGIGKGPGIVHYSVHSGF